MVPEQKGAAFFHGLRDGVLIQSGDKTPEPVLGMTVEKRRFPGLHRREAPENQNLGVFVPGRRERVDKLFGGFHLSLAPFMLL